MRIRRSRWWWLNPWRELRRMREWGRYWRDLYQDIAAHDLKVSSELAAIKRQRSETTRKGNATKAARRLQANGSTD